MEEVIGEYVLNLSNENLKIAALRGKIKLDNVQLDGDLIGSHVLGAVGLSGFGILSCYAKSVRIFVPWKNLEREPTRFEVQGVHLVCVPLMPSTATKMYGAGSQLDPRCALRTRAKRALLGRLERNYFSGRIAGEGPPSKRIRRAVKEVERDVRSKGKNRKTNGRDTIDEEDDAIIDSLINDMDSTFGGSELTGGNNGEEKSAKDPMTFTTENLPELPRDWKVKIREKALRNMAATMSDLHIRCEVSEGGLDFCHPDHRRRASSVRRPSSSGNSGDIPPDQRPFSFGFTMDSLVLRTANENWAIGSHEKFSSGSQTPRSKHNNKKNKPQDHLGPNEYVARNNKIASINNLKMYWDDEPPILLSETDVLTGNVQKLSAEKLQSRIAAAMDALVHQQEPGEKLRSGLHAPVPQDILFKPHQYICENISGDCRIKTSDRTLPGPVSCSAEFMPFELRLFVRPHQYMQYQTLKKAMLSQQRFDTMLRQRPKESVKENPRAWWAYAIACVTSRPNWRAWSDVLQIVRNRGRYIELVVKKLMNASVGSGFHGGLSSTESGELLALEDLLPVEALLAFHLLALRRFYELQKNAEIPKELGTPTKSSKSKKGITRFFFGSNKWKRKVQNSSYYHPTVDHDDAYLSSVVQPHADSSTTTASSGFESESLESGKPLSLLAAMTLRLGVKAWFIACKLADAAASVTLLSAKTDAPIVQLSLRTSGIARSFGKGKRDFFFDVTKFEIVDCRSRNAESPVNMRSGSGMGKQVLIVRPAEDEMFSDLDSTDARMGEEARTSPVPSNIFRDAFVIGPQMLQVENFKDLPPSGVVCRVAAAKNFGSVKLSVAAHPATLVWTTPCIEAIKEFFATPALEKTDLTLRLRSAATPLARKAQLALLSPASLALHINIAAPKVWLPISSRGLEGALFLDAGNFKLSSTKGEGETNMNWKLNADNLQVHFLRGRTLAQLQERVEFPHATLEANKETSIVRPFHVNAIARDREVSEVGIPEFNRYGGSGGTLVRTVEVRVSPISLNLVDAEGLARSIGKWYGQGILSFRKRMSTRRQSTKSTTNNKKKFEKPLNVETNKGDHGTISAFSKANTVPHNLSVTVEKIEMALEGHSKQHLTNNLPDDRSLASVESMSVIEQSPSTRFYVVEVFGISARCSRVNESSTTKFLVTDASIVQLKDASSYVPMKSRHEVSESQYCILKGLNPRRPFHERGKASEVLGPAGDKGIISASLFHDGVAHLDEMEVDIDSVVVRVTPTSLKDFLKGLRRIIELMQLMTKEMERKVHEEGRKARRRDRHSTWKKFNNVLFLMCWISSGSPFDFLISAVIDAESLHQESPSSSSDFRPPSPAHSEAHSEASSTIGQESELPPSDSSLLLKVTIRESTLLAGRPTNTKSSERRSRRKSNVTSFAVIQVLSNALIMFQSVENPDGSGSKTLHTSLDNLSASVNTEFEKIPLSEAPPMIGPTGAEFRIVYATENLGWVVSQDISLDCETLKSCLTPNDMFILLNISRKMLERLRAFDIQNQEQSGKIPSRPRPPKRSALSLIRYQKKGTGIATRIRAEIQSFSFVLLRAYRSKYGATEFLDFNVQRLKGKLEGCMSALSGEIGGLFSVNFFNSDVADWEYAVEPFDVTLAVDQMPNELVSQTSEPRKPSYFRVAELTPILPTSIGVKLVTIGSSAYESDWHLSEGFC